MGLTSARRATLRRVFLQKSEFSSTKTTVHTLFCSHKNEVQNLNLGSIDYLVLFCETNHSSHITRQQPTFLGEGPTTSVGEANFFTLLLADPLSLRCPFLPFLLLRLLECLWLECCWPMSSFCFLLEWLLLWPPEGAFPRSRSRSRSRSPRPWSPLRGLCWATRCIDRCFFKSARVWAALLSVVGVDPEGAWFMDACAVFTLTCTLTRSMGPARHEFLPIRTD